jgi:hypothetical protein
MKIQNFIIIVLLLIGCDKIQRDDSIVKFKNFPTPLSFEIETDTLFLTESEFNNSGYNDSGSGFNPLVERSYTICIPPDMHRFDEKTSDIIASVIGTHFYYNQFFFFGNLNLQDSIKSVVILDYRGDYHSLWLLNLKNNNLCSAIMLYDDNEPFISSTRINNKILQTNRTEHKIFYWYFSFTPYKDVRYSKYRINKEGHIEFVK